MKTFKFVLAFSFLVVGLVANAKSLKEMKNMSLEQITELCREPDRVCTEDMLQREKEGLAEAFGKYLESNPAVLLSEAESLIGLDAPFIWQSLRVLQEKVKQNVLLD